MLGQPSRGFLVSPATGNLTLDRIIVSCPFGVDAALSIRCGRDSLAESLAPVLLPLRVRGLVAVVNATVAATVAPDGVLDAFIEVQVVNGDTGAVDTNDVTQCALSGALIPNGVRGAV
jgi:hypothetical protein